MHILMDNGLHLQDIWPGSVSLNETPPASGTRVPSGHLAFWREFYPDKDVVHSVFPENIKDDSGFWSTLNITAHTPSSQYDLLRRHWLPQARKLGPVAWLALTGDGFHGQRQRTWEALPGNLHLSVGVLPNLPANRFSPALTMLPAVCLLDVLLEYPLDHNITGIKWVNDVLVGRRKLAGVLTSARTEQGLITGAVLGFGLNIERAPDLPRSSFVQGSTCMRDQLGPETPSLGELVSKLMAAVARRLLELQKNGPMPLFKMYRSHSLILDQKVEIWPEDAGGDMGIPSAQDPLRQGKVQSIQPDLGLIFEGQAEPVTSGRLVWK
jgi:BirA family transcriptional regulator, biotin operon repressor / biotin---[acetyl-CoA-carboxylase] ligase